MQTTLKFTHDEIVDLLAAYKNFNGFRSGSLEGDDQDFCVRLQERLERAVKRLEKNLDAASPCE